MSRNALDSKESPATRRGLDAGAQGRQQSTNKRFRDCPGAGACVHEHVEWQSEETPDGIAVASAGVVLSYGVLNAQADSLAGCLRDLGAVPETVVGLCLPRSAALLVGALGILKSGAAYLPLDPSDPDARLDFMLKDSGVSILVIDSALGQKAVSAGRHVVVLDASGRIVDVISTGGRAAAASAGIAPRVDGSNLAYVIYTSGSTGIPKGVEITHENLSNLVAWHRAEFRLTPADRAGLVARVGFDASAWEIWPCLAAGACLCVPEQEKLQDPQAFQDWLCDDSITITFVPTPIAERLLRLPWPGRPALRTMLTGGDTLHTWPPRDLPFTLVNNYGPTECTVVAASAAVPAAPSAGRLPPIGRPIANAQIYVLDEALQPVTGRDTGEIYIGGKGVGRGYRNRPELTAERFVPDPFYGVAGRMFKTGDLGQVLPDGQIAFWGRLDEQVKIRGFRIEPNEIAAALNEHPKIYQSLVTSREATPGEPSLVAYVVPVSCSDTAPAELREFLGSRLPAYMIPSTFVKLATLPLTSNGKIDRGALPAPDSGNTLRDQSSRGPETPAEQIVAGILAPLLGVEEVDVEANFFSLGGHSLLGIQLISRLRASLGIELPLRTVFEAPSVVDLAAEIERLLCARLEVMSEDEVRQDLGRSSPTTS